MTLLDMGIQIILVSASGVLSPGPLFFANLVLSKYEGFWSGFKVAVGHSIIELPVIILFSLPFMVFSFLNVTNSSIKYISFIGGISLIAFGIFYMVKIIRKNDKYHDITKSSKIENPFLTGILFTGLNPFFFIWWMSVGIKLISDSTALLGYPVGIAFLFVVHVWMDYAWLGLSSHFAFMGIKLIQSGYYKFVILLLAVPLFYYGINFIVGAIR